MLVFIMFFVVFFSVFKHVFVDFETARVVSRAGDCVFWTQRVPKNFPTVFQDVSIPNSQKVSSVLISVRGSDRY